MGRVGTTILVGAKGVRIYSKLIGEGTVADFNDNVVPFAPDSTVWPPTHFAQAT